MRKKKNYLVTGGAGFIGAALAERLLAVGHAVTIIDNLSTGFMENVNRNARFIEGECQDPAIYGTLIDTRFDAIFHIAGQSSGEISFDDPSYDLRTNAESTLHILHYALKSGCKRIVYASTMSIYGTRPDSPVAESEETFPESFYGVGKLASENYLRIYERYGINATSLRLFNVYGKGQNMSNMRQGMVSIYMEQMLDSGHIIVKGENNRFRDFVYIDDVVDAFLACLENPLSGGKSINIGTGVRTEVIELLNKMIALYGKKVTVSYEASTPGDIHGIYADITAARNILNYFPKYDLNSGLKKMLAWAMERG